MKRLTILPISILALCFVACSNPDKSPENAGKSSMDKFKSYSVDVLSPTSDIFESIENVEVMMLEQTDESLLTFVSKSLSVEDHFVIKNGNKSELLIYSEQGKFIRKINNQGDGPQEYRSIWDLWIEGNLIGIYDNLSKRIVKYDLEGNFIEAQRISTPATHVHYYNGGYALDVSNSLVDDSLKYNVMLIDEKMSRKALIAPYENRKNGGIVWYLNNFTDYGSKLLYQNTFGDTIYTLKENNAIPLLSIDFGNEWVWKDTEIYTDPQKQRQLMSEKGMVKMFFMLVSEKQVFFTTLKNNGLFVLDRATGNYRRFDMKKKTPGKFMLNGLKWEENRMLFGTDSGDIGEFLSQLNPNQVKFRTGSTLEEIESSENPLLIWIKFKDQL